MIISELFSQKEYDQARKQLRKEIETQGETRQDLINQIKRNAKMIKDSLTEHTDSNNYKLHTEMIKKLTGTKKGLLYATGNISRMNKMQLRQIRNYQNKMIDDSWVTDTDSIIKRMFKNYNDIDVDSFTKEQKTNYLKVIDIFTSDSYEILKEKHFIASSQIVDALANVNANINFSDLQREIDRLARITPPSGRGATWLALEFQKFFKNYM